jgi:FtsH-binding integral membrane protein
MHLVTFIVALVFIVVAAILFGRGLVKLYQKKEESRGLISSGFMVGLWGVVIAVILFGFFSL